MASLAFHATIAATPSRATDRPASPGREPARAIALIRLTSSLRRSKSAALGVVLVLAILATFFFGQSHEASFQATVRELHGGTTCEARRAAVRRLHRMNDQRAIVELRRARYRMRGGVLGIGDHNTNACLKEDAIAAIEYLQSLL
jgi:excinuclease UvrABC helicase subunit UvrB